MASLHPGLHEPSLSRGVDLALAFLCVLLSSEAVLLAPLNQDAAISLRQARAQAAGAVPCRDIYCEYTPLVPTMLAAVGGAPVASMGMIQIAIFACALLTYRLARALGNPEVRARRMAVVTWLLVLVNEGRAIELESFTLICLLCAATSFASSPGGAAALRSGLWIGAGFWAKQYALVGWAALLVEAVWRGNLVRAMALTAGTALAMAAGFGVLVAFGTEPARFASLFDARGYPPNPFGSNLATAPDLVLMLILTWSMLTVKALRSDERPISRLPFLMCAAALIPLYFRGYRHYWHFVIPFLVMIMLPPGRTVGPSWAPAARRGVAFLMLISVGIDVRHVVRDVVTEARRHQREEAETLTGLAREGGPVLYLVDPGVLAWVDVAMVAPREVGPKFTRFTRREAADLLSSASVVVWDPTYAGADEALRQLAGDPAVALSDRGFRQTATSGPFRVYSRGR